MNESMSFTVLDEIGREVKCEAGTNIKLMQDILGHQDISTTMNIYADVTKELREKELGNLEAYFAKQEE